MTCSVESCDRKVLCKGMCSMHYQRLRNRGSTETPFNQLDAQDRFDRRYKVSESGCWEWLGKLDEDGYAHLRVDGKKVPAHRYSYERFVGPIPDGLVMDHLCRVRRCVNPDHLEPVTNRENVLRGETFAAANAAKDSCVRGHSLTGSNLRIGPGGRRQCRACDRYYNRLNGGLDHMDGTYLGRWPSEAGRHVEWEETERAALAQAEGKAAA